MLYFQGQRAPEERIALLASEEVFVDDQTAIMEPSRVSIFRPSYTHVKFDETFGYNEPVSKTCKSKVTDYFKEKCSVRTLLSFFPFINVLKTYKWKSWIVKDIIAGLTVGVMHVPQSMGFALLTQVKPVYGLYSSFFPVVLYCIFGTSRHASHGTMAVISLMIGSVVQAQSKEHTQCKTEYIAGLNATNPEQECEDFKVAIATSVSLIAGAFQLGMSLLQLGAITRLMSSPFVGGFTAGAVMHITTSQVKSMLGLVNLKPVSDIFKLPRTYYEIFKIIHETNITELIITIISLFLLNLIKEGINDRFKKKLPIPIPAELIVVILGILISHFALLPNNFDVRPVGDIPTGFPAPVVPSMHNASSYIVDGFLVALISFIISFAVSKLFADMYTYDIDNNQEMLACGISYGFGTFFHSFYGAVAPPRCFVHDSTGGQTQVANVFAALLIMLVILVMGPLFESLPVSVLASIIVAALVPVFKSFATLKPLWKVNKPDFFVWFLTWLAVTVLNVDIGLGIGIGLAIIMPALHSLFGSTGNVMGRANSELYARQSHYKQLQKIPGVHVFRFEFPLFYMTAENFKKQLYTQTLNPVSLAKELEAAEKRLAKDTEKENKEKENPEKFENNLTKVEDKENPIIILDLSSVSYIDIVGLNTLKLVNKEYKKASVQVVVASCVQEVLTKIKRADVPMAIFPSVEDAIAETIKLSINLTTFVENESEL